MVCISGGDVTLPCILAVIIRMLVRGNYITSNENRIEYSYIISVMLHCLRNTYKQEHEIYVLTWNICCALKLCCSCLVWASTSGVCISIQAILHICMFYIISIRVNVCLGFIVIFCSVQMYPILFGQFRRRIYLSGQAFII